MSVAKRVAAAFEALAKDDYEQAFHDICSAIEVTANGEFGQGGRGSYKRLIADNFELVSRLAFPGTTMRSLRVAYNHPDVPLDDEGFCSIEDIVYHAIRCGLYHTATMPVNLSFANSNTIVADGGHTLQLPSKLILGLIAAIVTSPSNSSERIQADYSLSYQGISIPFSKLWGKRDELNSICEAADQLQRAIAAL